MIFSEERNRGAFVSPKCNIKLTPFLAKLILVVPAIKTKKIGLRTQNCPHVFKMCFEVYIALSRWYFVMGAGKLKL